MEFLNNQNIDLKTSLSESLTMESNDERIWPVLNAIIACDGFEQVGQSILKPLTELFAADSAIYIEITRKTHARPVVNRCFSYGEKSKIIDQYVNDFYHEDPLIFPATKIEYGSPLSDIQKVQLREQGQLQKLDKRTRYYKQFIEANDLEDVLGSIFPIGNNNDRFICVGVHKFKHSPHTEQSAAFIHQDYFALEKLLRPLGTTFNHIFYKSIGNELTSLVALLQSGYENQHYIFFDAQMTVRHSSHEIPTTNYALIIDRANLRKLQQHAILMQNACTSVAAYPRCESLHIDGLGQVKLLLAVDNNGEINYLLMWEKIRTPPQPICVSRNTPASTSVIAELTDREKQVIQQLALGKSNKLIADELHISIRTVENHLRSIYEKLGVHTRGQLVHAISTPHTATHLSLS